MNTPSIATSSLHTPQEWVDELMEIIRNGAHISLWRPASTHRTIRTPDGTFVTGASTQQEMDDFTRKLNTSYGL